MQMSPYLSSALLLMVCCAAITDLTERRIPNRLLLAALATAFALHLVSPRPGDALLTALYGAAAGFGLFIPFYLLRGMAAGDVKMMATVGAFVGPAAALQVAVSAWLLGGVMGLVIILVTGRWRAAMASLRTLLEPMMVDGTGPPENGTWRSVGGMPYGVAIAAATLVYLVRMTGA